ERHSQLGDLGRHHYRRAFLSTADDAERSPAEARRDLEFLDLVDREPVDLAATLESLDHRCARHLFGKDLDLCDRCLAQLQNVSPALIELYLVDVDKARRPQRILLAAAHR